MDEVVDEVMDVVINKIMDVVTHGFWSVLNGLRDCVATIRLLPESADKTRQIKNMADSLKESEETIRQITKENQAIIEKLTKDLRTYKIITGISIGATLVLSGYTAYAWRSSRC